MPGIKIQINLHIRNVGEKNMDWKEGAKWLALLVGAGLITAVIEVVIENQISGTAKTAARVEARAEVQRTITAAIQQSSIQQQQLRNSRVTSSSSTQTAYTPNVAVDPKQQGSVIHL